MEKEARRQNIAKKKQRKKQQKLINGEKNENIESNKK